MKKLWKTFVSYVIVFQMKDNLKISLDTNIWMFGLEGANPSCEKILANVAGLNVAVPDRVRIELEGKLPKFQKKRFYKLVQDIGIEVDFTPVPSNFIELFKQKGLKKGDAEIGAFCEWRKIDIFISRNRDFLKGLTSGHHFRVLSPECFCEEFGL